MSKLAVEYNAINLGQGFPGFQMDMRLGSLVEKFIRLGYNQYAPMQGIPELRKLLSKKIERMYGRRYDSDTEITITAGGTQAIYTAITALVGQGDEVILFAPAYDCYAPAIELNGGKPIWLNLKYPEYRINWNEVRHSITENTRMIVINSPHNPSGTCMTEQDMLELEKIVTETGIFVISDEVYEHIVFDGLLHQSAARFPELTKKTFLVYSFGKTFHNTGWKMGYICGPEEMMIEFRKVHQFNVFSCNTPIQYALAEFIQDESTFLSLPTFYELKRDFFLKELNGSRFNVLPAEGTYFQLLSYEGMFDESDTDLAIRLTKEFGVASIPCSVFYPNGLDEKVLRFCFAKENAVLEKAGAILRSI